MKKLFGLLVLVMALCMMGAASADDCQHEFGVKSCTKERCCSKCGQWFTTSTTHNWGSWSSGTGPSHMRSCTNYQCEAVDGGAHTGGTATCTKQAICEGCSMSYGELDMDNHDWGFEVTPNNDGSTHTRICQWDSSHTKPEACSRFSVLGDLSDKVNHKILCECFRVLGTESHTMTDWFRDGDGWRRECTANCDYYEESSTDPSTGGESDTTATPPPSDDPPAPPVSTPRPHSHSYTGTVYAATCTSGGYTYYWCGCGDGFVGSRVEALGHAWGAWEPDNHGGHTRVCTRDAAHTEQGSCFDSADTDELCDGCGYDLHVHRHDGYAYDRTTHWLVCKCGDALAAEKHDWYIYKKDAKRHYWHCDCGDDGWADAHFDNNNTGKCDDCGYAMPHTHDYTAVVTAPTCKEQGYTTYTCSCNDSYVSDYVDALGHDWGDYESDGNGYHTRTCTTDSSHYQTEKCGGGTATCTEPATCSDCGATYGSLNSTNHSSGTELRDVKDATETEDGYTGDTYCLGCGYKLSEGNTIPATGSGDDDDDDHTHNYSYYKYDGTNHWKMCICGQGQAGSVKPHSLVITGASTGHVEECTVCNYFSDVEAHVYSDDSDAYCNECGYRRHVHDHSTAATCKSPAKCSCGVTTGSKDSSNHVGGTEIRNAVKATIVAEGYTGDTYCLGCGSMIASGEVIPKAGVVFDGPGVEDVTFIPAEGVELPEDAEIIVNPHTPSADNLAYVLGIDADTEYLDADNVKIQIVGGEDYTAPDGTEYRMHEIIIINGEEYLITNYMGVGDVLVLMRLSDGATGNYNVAVNKLDFTGSMNGTVQEYAYDKINIGGITYDVRLSYNSDAGRVVVLYYNGSPAGKMYINESRSSYFREGFDPETLKVQQNENDLGTVTPGENPIDGLVSGKTYNVSVVGSDDIHLEGAENVGGIVTQTFEIPAEFVGNENVKYIAVHDTNPYADALAEALAKQVENFTMEGAQEYLDIKALYNAWAEENAAGKTNRVSGIVDEDALLDDAENASDALAVQYTAKHGIVGGYELGKTFLSEDGKTLTATYEVNSFSPFIVYAFVEADEPEIKEFVTQPDGTLGRPAAGQ